MSCAGWRNWAHVESKLWVGCLKFCSSNKQNHGGTIFYILILFDLFLAHVPILYPLKTAKKLFLFSGDVQWKHWLKLGYNAFLKKKNTKTEFNNHDICPKLKLISDVHWNIWTSSEKTLNVLEKTLNTSTITIICFVN